MYQDLFATGGSGWTPPAGAAPRMGTVQTPGGTPSYAIDRGMLTSLKPTPWYGASLETGSDAQGMDYAQRFKGPDGTEMVAEIDPATGGYRVHKYIDTDGGWLGNSHTDRYNGMPYDIYNPQGEFQGGGTWSGLSSGIGPWAALATMFGGPLIGSGLAAMAGAGAAGAGAGAGAAAGAGELGAAGIAGLEAGFIPATGVTVGGPIAGGTAVGTGIPGLSAVGGAGGALGAVGAGGAGAGGAGGAGGAVAGAGTPGVMPPNPYNIGSYFDANNLSNLFTSGGGMFGGGGGGLGGWGNLFSSAGQLFSGLESRRAAGDAREQIMASMGGMPYSSALPDPNEVTKTPGYKAGLEAVRRTMASQGYQGSGNMMAALSKYGGDAYNQFVAQRQSANLDQIRQNQQRLAAAQGLAGPAYANASSLPLIMNAGANLFGAFL